MTFPPLASPPTAAQKYYSSRRSLSKTAGPPLPAILIILTLLLPEELSFYVGDLRLTLTRLIFLLLAPYLMLRFCQMCATGRCAILMTDILVVITSVWMFSAVTMVVGISEAVSHVGPDVLEFCIGYFAMRVLLSDHGQALSLINLLCLLIAVVALLGLLDTATNSFFIHDLLAHVTGYVKPRQHDHRYDFLRAASVLEHPIHFGIVCCFGLLFAVGVPIKARAFKIVACIIGLIASISSAPVQAAIIGVCLIIYGRSLARFRSRWLIVKCIIVVAILASAVKSPVNFINEHLIFDASSGWYREWEWSTALAILHQSPWFGIAYGWSNIASETGVVNSIDSLWLNTAVQFGYPGAILLLLTFISAAFCRTMGPKITLTDAETKLGTTLAIIISLVIVLGFTVHFWAIVWVLISLLAGVKVHLAALGAGQYSAHTKVGMPSKPRLKLSPSLSRVSGAATTRVGLMGDMTSRG